MYNISPPMIFETVDSLVRLRHPGSDGGHRSGANGDQSVTSRYLFSELPFSNQLHGL